MLVYIFSKFTIASKLKTNFLMVYATITRSQIGERRIKTLSSSTPKFTCRKQSMKII